jgi:hypothetical protein
VGLVVEALDAYLDAAPRSGAQAQEHGPFVIFVPDGVPWPYYARPRARLERPITRGDVAAVCARQRELGVPLELEWVHEATPSLAPAAVAAGLAVVRVPLLVLDALRPAPVPAGVRVELLDAGSPQLAAATAVAQVAFAAPGGATGPAGITERDAAAAALSHAELEPRRGRLREGLTVTAMAAGDDGPLCVGSHQPVGAVTEIVGVGTLPVARRRGLSAAVTSRRGTDAAGRGAETVFLSAADDAVARGYERLGFRRVGSACFGEPGPA